MLIYEHITIYGHLKSSYFAALNYILIGIFVHNQNFSCRTLLYSLKITVSLTYFVAQTTKFQDGFSVHITINGNFIIENSSVIFSSKIDFNILIITISDGVQLIRHPIWKLPFQSLSYPSLLVFFYNKGHKKYPKTK